MSEVLGSNSDNPEDEQNRQDGPVHLPLPYFGEVEKGVYSFIGPKSLPTSEQAPAPEAEAPDDLQLHICPECTSDSVYPQAWEERGKEWLVYLRCPECDWQHEGIYDDETTARLDSVFINQYEELEATLRRLDRENMENIIAAIKNDHILPMDF